MQRTLLPLLLCLLLASAHVSLAVGLPPNTQIQIVATADYVNALNEQQTADPASVTLTVLQVVGAQITWTPTQEVVTQGRDTYVPATITNIGNGADTLDLSAVSSHGWRAAIVYDENADGIHQDGEVWEITDTTLVADGYCSCFIRLSVPADAATGDTVVVRATSRLAPAQGSATENVTIGSPGMLDSRLELTATPESPIVGQAVTINGQIAPVVSDAIGVTVTDPSGHPTTSSCTPGDDGSFSASFTPSQSGTYTVEAVFSGNDSHMPSSANIGVDVSAKTATTIAMQIVPTNPTAGGEVAVSGTITPAMATALTLTYQPPSGASTQSQVTTDQFGRFSATKTVSAAGAWTITADYPGSASFSASTVQVTVQAEAQPAQHAVEFTAVPSALPSRVTYPESTQCSASARDSAGHSLGYTWSDGGAGGAFSPSANVASPVYLAPANLGGQDAAITLTCTAKCTVDTAVAVVASAALTSCPSEAQAPTVLSVAPQPGSTLADLGSDIMIRFSEPMSTSAVQQAISFSPAITGTTYTWDGAGMLLTIRHQALTPATTYTCSVSTTARDASGVDLAAAYQWNFTTVPAVRFDPAEVGAGPSTMFATPRIIVSDPLQPASVSFKVTVPDGLVVNDSADGDGNLVCVKKGEDAGEFHSEWNSTTREITVTASVPTPSLSAEIVKAIRLGAPASPGSFQLRYQGTPSLAVTVRDLVPGDFNGDGLVNITDAVRFTQAWTRWQADPPPTWDADVDEPYDLAPHTEVAWPNWTTIGDHVIDSLDASAFTDCWSGAHSGANTASASSYRPTLHCQFSAAKAGSDTIFVTVAKAVDGLFEAVVSIPEGARFDSTTSRAGSLSNVVKGAGAGSVVFSEYDPQTRTVRLAGTVAGAAPYAVATIHLSK